MKTETRRLEREGVSLSLSTWAIRWAAATMAGSVSRTLVADHRRRTSRRTRTAAGQIDQIAPPAVLTA
jgi:hypothetical protein